MNATSAGSARSARRHAARLALSSVHFTGQRRWSDATLMSAVASSRSWTQVATELNLVAEGGTMSSLKSHAHRLCLDVAHLGPPNQPRPAESSGAPPYRPECLRDAGPVLAATWFALRAAKIAWPLEPCRYDLLVDLQDELHRVQVKTTTGEGEKAILLISNSRRKGRRVYTPGEVSSFFAIDAALTAYWIPYDLVAGYAQIQLGHYRHFRVVERGRLLDIGD